jgi:sugar/nucleoside kinase (ribokinase family)
VSALSLALLQAGSRPFDVVAFGESSADIVAQLDSFPEPGAKTCARRLDVHAGGQAATAVAATTRLGWRGRYHGFIGTDDWGAAIEATLRETGVDVAAIRKPDARTRRAVILIEPSGARTILADRDPRQALAAADIDPRVVTSGRVLIVDAVDAAASAAAARAARETGMATVVDVDAPAEGLDALLSSIDVLITSETFPEAWTGASSLGQGLRELARRFNPAVAVATLGEHGALAIAGGREIRTPAPQVEAVDTTGAGDAFRGGFVDGWLAAPHASVEDILRHASRVAALSCTRVGAIAGLPDRTELERFVTAGRRA